MSTSSLKRKMHATSAINLYKGRNRNFVDRFIKWALSAGRLIIILTEIIALSAFLYRFSLDRNLIDLNDQIKNEEARLNILKVNEEKYRNLQDRLSEIAKLSNATDSTLSTLNTFINNIPPTMSFSTIQFTSNTLNMAGNVPSVASLFNFIKSLKEDPQIKNVSLGRIENKISNSTILFTLTVVFNN